MVQNFIAQSFVVTNLGKTCLELKSYCSGKKWQTGIPCMIITLRALESQEFGETEHEAQHTNLNCAKIFVVRP